MKRGRKLSDDERAIWKRTTKDVRPLMPLSPPPSPLPSSQKPTPRRPDLMASGSNTIAPMNASPRDLFRAGDPKSTKRIARGTQSIDATLDLHGHTQRTGLLVFRQFIANAALLKNRNLLIITGKGRRNAAQREYEMTGVLRERIRDWVQLPEIRPYIARVSDAHPRHGGSGALYIVLKNR